MAEKPKMQKSLEDEETTDVDESENNDSSNESDDESEKEIVIPEPLAPNRGRRHNAGNKMAELLNSAVTSDEFYETAYGGGFKEDDVDDNFMSPQASDNEDDEVDSDFDRPEDEDEQDVNMEEEEDFEKRNEKRRLLEKNRQWVAARFNKFVVDENSCDPKTQQERLEEAKLTEQFNIASLKRFEEVELERKKRQTKPSFRQRPVGPVVKTISKMDGNLMVIPELKSFSKPERREYRVCAVTGRKAKYIDPLTELPYADLEAFKQIRTSYKEYLQSYHK